MAEVHPKEPTASGRSGIRFGFLVFWISLIAFAGGWVAYLWPVDRDGEFIKILGANGMYGFINGDGRIVIEPAWHDAEADQLEELGLVRVLHVEGDVRKWGLLNRRAEVVLPATWNTLSSFDPNSGFSRVSDGEGNWGYINRRGETVIEPEFSFVAGFDPAGMAPVLRDSKWGWIDMNGEFVIPPTWRNIEGFDSEGMAAVSNGDLFWAWIDRDGKTVIPVMECWGAPEFDMEGLWAVTKDMRTFGWMNRRGEVVIPPAWNDHLGGFGPHGMAAVARNKSLDSGHVSEDGADKATGDEGTDSSWGWINKVGEVVIPLRWDHCGNFDEEGMARVCKGGKWGWIDTSGNVVIPLEWISSGEFDAEGMAQVTGADGIGWIDRKGKIVVACKWGYASEFNKDGLALAHKTDLPGQMELRGYYHDVSSYVSNWSEPIYTDGEWIDRRGDKVISLPKEGNWKWANRSIGPRMVGPKWQGMEPDLGTYVATAELPIDSLTRKVYLRLARWLKGDSTPIPETETACIAYNTVGDLIWDSRWMAFETKCWLVIGLAGVALMLSGVRVRKVGG